MFHIYYGREDKSKEAFIFDQIKQSEGKVLLLVPDQYTLQAEKEAFFFLETKGLMDIEVLSFSRLCSRVLAEVGGSRKTPIDQYGRYMLIAKIIAEQKGNLKVYNGSMPALSQMVNDLIYEMKQYNTAASELLSAIKSIEEESILKRKLADIHTIYVEYEKYMGYKYLDGEDYISLLISKIHMSELIRSSTVWIYGFDDFTPKNIEVLAKLMVCAKDVNLVLTSDKNPRDYEVFELTEKLIDRLSEKAEHIQVPLSKMQIPAKYVRKREKNVSLTSVESELYAIPVKHAKTYEGITLIKAANLYSEAESAASYVLDLTRDCGLKYKDIAIICNDMETRAPIAKRIFSEYGIELFLDKKRNLMHSPVVRFIMSLLDIATNGYRSNAIFTHFKTGLSDLSEDQIEQLENYVIKYKIKGTRWQEPFKKGLIEYGETTFVEINETRETASAWIKAFEKPFKKAETVAEKAIVLYEFLRDTAKIPEKLESLAQRQAADGEYELAEETVQTWATMIKLLDQLVELIGEERVIAANFAEIMQVGLESIEIGLLPPTEDGLIMGTMQRTRIGRIKALLVIGANEGILPLAAAQETLLNDDEKIRLFSKGIEICRREDFREKEEALAIYRNLSRPSEYLFMSHSISDAEGKKLNPSPIFNKMIEIFPEITVQNDVLNRTNAIDLIQSSDNSFLHLSHALRDSLDSKTTPSEEWQAVIEWHKSNNAGGIKFLTEGLFFANKQKKLKRDVNQDLYKRDGDSFILSPSRLERYGRCPFSHFVNYGLRPDERRIFEPSYSEFGDLYHSCLMKLSMELTKEGIGITADESPWMNITRDQCQTLVNKFIEEDAHQYREGLFEQGKAERYRMSRMKTVCGDAAWVMIHHVRCGKIKSIAFEAEFGKSNIAHSKSLPPIEIQITSSEQILIEGKIDRVDTLADGSVKIIDYKSGYEQFDIEEAKAGWRLQLLLYLKAAQQEKAEPAGVFYFMLDEQMQNAGKENSGIELNAKIKEKILNSFKMNGILTNKISVIESIAGDDFTGYSQIVPIFKKKEGEITGHSLLSPEEFKALQTAVDEKVRELCREIADGCTDVRPMKTMTMTACKYCKYKSICHFDLALEGCNYKTI